MTVGRKTGGRQAGTKNRTTERMRLDIMATYRKLGGRAWLLKFAKENSVEFVAKCLARVMPPMPREETTEGEPLTPPSFFLPEVETARRIAFVLSGAAHADGGNTIEGEAPFRLPPTEYPQPEPAVEIPPYAAPSASGPTYPPRELAATPAQRQFARDVTVCEETHTADISSYRGSNAEQAKGMRFEKREAPLSAAERFGVGAPDRFRRRSE